MFKKALIAGALLVGSIFGTLAMTDTAEARPRGYYRGGGYYGRPYYRNYGYSYRPYRYYNYGYRPYYYGGYYGRPYYNYGYGGYGGGVYIGRGGVSIGW